VVDVPVPGIQVQRNGEDLPSSVWGIPVHVDPGPIKITAAAPWREAWEGSLTLGPSSGTTVHVPQPPRGRPPGWASPPPPPMGMGPSSSELPPGMALGSGPSELPSDARTKRRSLPMMNGGVTMISLAVLPTALGVGAAVTNTPSIAAGFLVPGVALLAGGV